MPMLVYLESEVIFVNKMDHTEILDDEVVQILQDSVSSPKKNISSYFRLVIYSLFLGFFAFQSFRMMQVSASVRDTSLDVQSDDLYHYEEVLFEDLYIPTEEVQ